MSFLKKLFSKPQTNAAEKMTEYMKTLDVYSPSFRAFDGGYYETELVRSVVHAKAKHTAKLTPHVQGNAYKNFENILKFKPNEFQSTYDFLYRTRTLYEVDTFVFIIPIFSKDFMHVDGLYPLKAQQVEIMEYNNEMWLRYTFANGEKAAIEYKYVGVLSKMNYRNEFMGDGNGVLYNTMDLLQLQNQGIQDAIKQSAAIRFMARLGQTMRPEDLEKERKEFTKQNLSMENQTGVMMFDQRYADVKQIDSKPYVADEKQLDFIKNNVYSYFGVNDDILQNSYTEDVWNAFYEGEIEPFAIQLSLAITNMLFTKKEIAHGNQIHFSSNRLQYASNKTKLEVSTQLFDRGIFGTNDVKEIWNLPADEENRFFIRGEYVGKNNINKDGTVDYKEVENTEETDDNKR